MVSDPRPRHGMGCAGRMSPGCPGAALRLPQAEGPAGGHQGVRGLGGLPVRRGPRRPRCKSNLRGKCGKAKNGESIFNDYVSLQNSEKIFELFYHPAFLFYNQAQYAEKWRATMSALF